MHTVIILIHLMIVLALVGLVLLQKSEGGGLGMGSSGGGGFMTSRGTANVLSRTTAILAALFFATSLVLSIIAGGCAASGALGDLWQTFITQLTEAIDGRPARH